MTTKDMSTQELEDKLAEIQHELKTRQDLSDQKSRLMRLKEMTEAQAYRFIHDEISEVIGNDNTDLDPPTYDYCIRLISDCVIYTYNHLQTSSNMEDYLRRLQKPLPKKAKPKLPAPPEE